MSTQHTCSVKAQLMQTNSNAFNRSVKVTKHGTIWYVRYGFLLVHL